VSFVKTVIGFDTRRHPEQYVSTLWNADRRERFLLAPGARWPLSVDTLVWPSVFAPHGPMSEEQKQLIGLEHALDITDACVVDDLWINLERMRHRYQREAPIDLHGIEIVVRLVRDSRRAPGHAEIAWLEHDVLPAALSDGRSLGYDVADGALISGLSNCGYERAEKRSLQPVWSTKLNEHGLLRELEDAERFKTVTDMRVPEHAPFSVFELLSMSDWR
jgi:hypothetical protein